MGLEVLISFWRKLSKAINIVLPSNLKTKTREKNEKLYHHAEFHGCVHQALSRGEYLPLAISRPPQVTWAYIPPVRKVQLGACLSEVSDQRENNDRGGFQPRWSGFPAYNLSGLQPFHCPSLACSLFGSHDREVFWFHLQKGFLVSLSSPRGPSVSFRELNYTL